MKGTMKGLIKSKPEPGAEYREDLPIPQIGPDDVLVKVKRTAICGTDIHIYDWTEYAKQRLKPPMVFGHEFSGEIVEVGSHVQNFKAGDRVAGETHIPCNNCIQCRTGNQHICESMKILGVHTPGSFAEYISVPVDCVWKIDDDIDDNIGAMLEPMGVAVHGILSGEIGGKSCVIYGCGPIGLMGVGAASACGASPIFAIDIFDDKLDIAKKMGATTVINAKKEDVHQIIMKATHGRGVDVVVDFTGVASAIQEGFKLLKKGGRFTFVGLPSGSVPLDLSEAIIYKEAKVNGITGRLMYETWYQCTEMLKSKRIDITPVIGGIYPLSEFNRAFEDLKNGCPGKMIFIP
ncbi:MAG: L-threonine 3-dehydrogenase [Bacillota bacterium]